MVRVKLKNGSGEELSVKEGNGGLYRLLATIRRDKEYTLSVNENATYREFLIVVSMSQIVLSLSSDDCLDYEEIEIKFNESRTKLDFGSSTPRRPGRIAESTTDAHINKSIKAASSWFSRFFSKKSSSQATARTSQS